jgi:hypothetical protein
MGYDLRYKGKLNALTFDLTDDGTYKMAGASATFTPDDGDPPYIGRVIGNTCRWMTSRLPAPSSISASRSSQRGGVVLGRSTSRKAGKSRSTS